jgi:hypothetical protein
MTKTLPRILRVSSGVLVLLGALAVLGCDGGDSSAPSPTPSTTPSSDTAGSDSDAAEEGEELKPGPIVSEADPEARAQIVEILNNPDPFERARLLGERLPKWTAEQAATVGHILEDSRLVFDATSFDLLIRVWAMHDPAAATDWALRRAPLLFRGAAVLEAFTLWAKVDPLAVAGQLEMVNAKYVDMSELAVTGLVRGWYLSGDISGLEAFMYGLGPGLPRQRMISQYLRTRLNAEGVDAVIAWAESVPDDDPGLKQTIYRQVTSNLPLFDFEAVLPWCERHCDGPYGDGLRGIIARRWVRTDGGSAILWLAGDYPGPGVDRDLDFELRLAFARWAGHDRVEATEWATAQLTDGRPEWMEPLLPVYARILAPEHPLDAVHWAEEIAEEADREIVLTDVARTWLQVDPEAAEEWLATSPLSEEARAEAHKPNKRRPTGY